MLRLPLLLSCVAVAGMAATAQESYTPLQEHLAAARRAQAAANCHLAAQEYHLAVQSMQSSGELRTNEGIALYCDEQLEPAVAALHTALRLNPSLVTPHLFLGLASFRLSDLKSANRELTLYLRRVPEDRTAHLWLGYTLAAQDDHVQALAQFAKVLDHDPESLDARYAFGLSALEIAHDKARELASMDPSGIRLLQLAAQQYRARGDEALASAAAAEAARRSAGFTQVAPENAKADQLANEARAAQEQALAAFQAILANAPDSYRAHQVLGDALLAANKDEAAIAEYETVLRMNPKLPGVHETLSACLISSGRFAEALDALDAERALSPVPSSRLLTRIGQAQHALGKDEEAAQSLQAAVKAPDAPATAYLLLARVQLAQGKAANAVTSLQHFLSLQPDNSTAYYDLSRAYRILGNKQEMARALADYQRTSQDAKSRALVASLTQDTSTALFAESDKGTTAEGQPAQHP